MSVRRAERMRDGGFREHGCRRWRAGSFTETGVSLRLMIGHTSSASMHGARAMSALLLGCTLISAVAAPVITRQPADLAVGPGDRAGFAVVATGSGALSYQWFRNGAAVSGGTTDVLLLPSAQVSDAGSYTVGVTDASGVTTSSAAVLSVAPYATQLVDPTFAPTDSSYFNPIVALPDGRLVIGRSHDASVNGDRASLLRVQTDGSVDPAFVAQLPSANFTSVTSIAVRNDGKYYVAGYAGPSSSGTMPFVYRLNADGGFDGTFSAPALASVPRVLVAVDDKLLIDLNGQLTRLSANGTVDPTFAFQSRSDGQGGAIRVAIAVPDATGRIFVAGATSLWRIDSDGSTDASFSAVDAGAVITSVVPSSSGVVVATRQTTVPYPDTSVVSVTFRLRRYTLAGSDDLSFHEFIYSRAGFAGGPAAALVAPQPDGQMLLVGDVTSVAIEANRSVTRPGILRILADGSLDTAFDPIDLNPVQGATPQYSRVVVLPAGQQAIIGTGTISSLRRITLDPIGAPQPPRILAAFPVSVTIHAGDDVTFNVVAVGPGPIQLGVEEIRAYPPAPTGTSVTLKNVQRSATYSVVAQGTGGRATQDATLTVIPSVPHFVVAPESITTTPGHDLQFVSDVRGTEPISYQWFHDGQPLSGETFSTLTRVNAGNADIGTYVLRATNSIGVAEQSATVTLGPTNEFLNVSARAAVGPGDGALILGLTVRAAYNKGAIIRGLGPRLQSRGIINPIADPQIAVYSPAGGVDANDNSNFTLPKLYPYSGATDIPWPSKEAELGLSLKTGAYTGVITGVSGTTGIALAEIFETDATTGQISNFSARTYVGTGEAITILGFVIRGDKPKRLLIRAVGPGLASLGVAGTLGDPVATLIDQSTHLPIASNNDWSAGVETDAIAGAAAAVGAFPLTTGSKDAAFIATLPAGAYTVLVSGADGGTGIALAEVYDLP